MPVPRGVTARKFIRALSQDGFILKRTRGSHRLYVRTDGRRIVVAYHRLGDTFPVGTLKSMIDAAGWSEEDLTRLNLISE